MKFIQVNCNFPLIKINMHLKSRIIPKTAPPPMVANPTYKNRLIFLFLFRFAFAFCSSLEEEERKKIVTVLNNKHSNNL